jgi:hypothetical protein
MQDIMYQTDVLNNDGGGLNIRGNKRIRAGSISGRLR